MSPDAKQDKIINHFSIFPLYTNINYSRQSVFLDCNFRQQDCRERFKSKKNLFFENSRKRSRKFSQKVSKNFIKSHIYIYIIIHWYSFCRFPRSFSDRFNEADRKYDSYIQFEYNNYRNKTQYIWDNNKKQTYRNSLNDCRIFDL